MDLKKDTSDKILWLILALAFIIRAFGINKILYIDEAMLANFTLSWNYFGYLNFFHLSFFQNLFAINQPPLVQFLIHSTATLTNNHTWVLRLLPILFGLLTIFYTYKLANKLFGKRTALFASLIMAFSFWHILASIQLERDGAFTTCFYVASIYYFLIYKEDKSTKNLLLLSLFLGMALLSKISSVMLFAIIASISLFEQRNEWIIGRVSRVKHSFNLLFKPFILAIIPIGIYAMLLFFSNKWLLLNTFFYSGSRLAAFNPNVFFYMFICGGPFLAGLTLLSFFWFPKKNLYFIPWVVMPILIYSFGNMYAPFERYLMVIIPALCISSAYFLANIKIGSKDVKAISFFIILFYSIFAILNLNTTYEYNSISHYFELIKELHLNFYLPITGPAGPTFGVSFLFIFAGISSAFLCLFLFFVFLKGNASNFLAIRYRRKARIALILFLSLSIAFNILLVQEMLFPIFHPDVSKISYEIKDYYEKNHLEGHLYTNAWHFYHYLNRNESDFSRILYGSTKMSYDDFKKSLYEKKGYVLILDYPILDKSEKEWELINKCRLLKTFYSIRPMGYIYDCNELDRDESDYTTGLLLLPNHQNTMPLFRIEE